MSKSENEISITARFEDFGSIQKELERRKLEISSSELEREAKINKALPQDERLKVERLINMIDEDDDVHLNQQQVDEEE